MGTILNMVLVGAIAAGAAAAVVYEYHPARDGLSQCKELRVELSDQLDKKKAELRKLSDRYQAASDQLASSDARILSADERWLDCLVTENIVQSYDPFGSFPVRQDPSGSDNPPHSFLEKVLRGDYLGMVDTSRVEGNDSLPGGGLAYSLRLANNDFDQQGHFERRLFQYDRTNGSFTLTYIQQTGKAEQGSPFTVGSPLIRGYTFHGMGDQLTWEQVTAVDVYDGTPWGIPSIVLPATNDVVVSTYQPLFGELLTFISENADSQLQGMLAPPSMTPGQQVVAPPQNITGSPSVVTQPVVTTADQEGTQGQSNPSAGQ